MADFGVPYQPFSMTRAHSPSAFLDPVQELDAEAEGEGMHSDIDCAEASGAGIFPNAWGERGANTFSRESKADGLTMTSHMATFGTMNLVMADRTGAKLLDLHTGDCAERKRIEEEFKELKAHRDQCEKVGRYAEAEEAAAKMHEIREKEDRKRREEMARNHLADKIKVENAELEELLKMSNSWDNRMDDFEAQCESSEDTMREKHEIEHEALKRRIFGPLERPKWSTHLLNLRKILETVGKQGDYDRAIVIQRQTNKLQGQEMRVLELEALERHEAAAEKLDEKHAQDRENFQDRVAFGRRKRDTHRTRDMKNLAHRFANIKRELALLQEKEMTQLEAAINSSLGLGKSNPETDMNGPFEVPRYGAEKMRTMQHAYDLNVRFGNKAGNASPLTSTMGLSAAANGEAVLGPRCRSGRAALDVSSPSLPQPTTGGAMPFYLKPGAFVPDKQKNGLRPSSRCSTAHVKGSDKKTIRNFLKQEKSASDAALGIYMRPYSAPVGTPSRQQDHFSRRAKPMFGTQHRPRSRGRTAPTPDKSIRAGLDDTAHGPDGPQMEMYPPQTPLWDVSGSPPDLSPRSSNSLADDEISTVAWGDHVSPSRKARKHFEPKAGVKKHGFNPPDFSGPGTRPPGAGRSTASSGRIRVRGDEAQFSPYVEAKH